MAQINLQIPQVGQPAASEDPKIASDFSTIQSAINGGLDSTNLAANPGVMLTATGSAGVSSVSASQSTSSASYTTLSTPDQVTGLVLPTNGLIAVWYQATWQESVAAAARAALFIGSTQLKAVRNSGGSGGPLTQAAQTGSLGTTGTNYVLSSCPMGLIGGFGSSAYPGDATTGQAVGVGPNTGRPSMEIGGGDYTTTSQDVGYGPCYIFAAAGTYTVAVKFKASSGTVTASNRRLWVQVLPFA